MSCQKLSQLLNLGPSKYRIGLLPNLLLGIISVLKVTALAGTIISASRTAAGLHERPMALGLVVSQSKKSQDDEDPVYVV